MLLTRVNEGGQASDEWRKTNAYAIAHGHAKRYCELLAYNAIVFANKYNGYKHSSIRITHHGQLPLLE